MKLSTNQTTSQENLIYSENYPVAFEHLWINVPNLTVNTKSHVQVKFTGVEINTASEYLVVEFPISYDSTLGISGAGAFTSVSCLENGGRAITNLTCYLDSEIDEQGPRVIITNIGLSVTFDSGSAGTGVIAADSISLWLYNFSNPATYSSEPLIFKVYVVDVTAGWPGVKKYYSEFDVGYFNNASLVTKPAVTDDSFYQIANATDRDLYLNLELDVSDY